MTRATASARFERATSEDDAAIRALLRGQSMGREVRLTLEREPCFEHGCEVEGDRHHVFVLREAGTRRVLGLASRSVSRVWLRGTIRRLGYLASMRRTSGLRVTRRLLAEAFAACEATRCDDELPFDLTSILSENTPARRLLERGLPGLPAYSELCRYETLTLDVGAHRRRRLQQSTSIELRQADVGDHEALIDHLQKTLATHPLAPVWTARDLCSSRTRGLGLEDFLLAFRGGRLVGCLAVWDQRGFKQTVVEGYSWPVAVSRPVLNPVRRMFGMARLPAPREALRLAFLSHAAVTDDDPEVLVSLVGSALRSSSCADLAYVVLGLPQGSPMLPPLVRAFHPHRLESVLYRVDSDRDAASMESISGRPRIEVALL